MPGDAANRLDLERPDIATYLALFDAYNAAPRRTRDRKLVAALFEEAGDALIGPRPRPRRPEPPLVRQPAPRWRDHRYGLEDAWARLPPDTDAPGTKAGRGAAEDAAD